MQESWDIIIILDACRYDYFEKIYRDYLKGHLTKQISPGTWTFEWARNNFNEHYDDVVYVSANPHIRNANIPLDSVYDKWIKDTTKDKFISEKHFYKIIDVWINGWDNDFNTVHPKTMNKVALYALKNYPDKKLIIHYMQPHEPFLDLDWVNCSFPRRLRDKMKGFIHSKLVDIFSTKKSPKIKTILDALMTTKQELYINKQGIKAFCNLYEYNLKIVLKYVAELLDYLEGIIIITADHGELLGENNLYWHSSKDYDFTKIRPKELIEIPWLITHQDYHKKKIPENTDFEEHKGLSENDEKIIIEKLKLLGYIE